VAKPTKSVNSVSSATYEQVYRRVNELIRRLDDYKKLRPRPDFEAYKRYWLTTLGLTEVECQENCVVAVKSGKFELHLHRKGRKTYIVDKTPIF